MEDFFGAVVETGGTVALTREGDFVDVGDALPGFINDKKDGAAFLTSIAAALIVTGSSVAFALFSFFSTVLITGVAGALGRTGFGAIGEGFSNSFGIETDFLVGAMASDVGGTRGAGFSDSFGAVKAFFEAVVETGGTVSFTGGDFVDVGAALPGFMKEKKDGAATLTGSGVTVAFA